MLDSAKEKEQASSVFRERKTRLCRLAAEKKRSFVSGIYRGLAQLVARRAGGAEVARSSRVAPTTDLTQFDLSDIRVDFSEIEKYN